jgi:hypothetical protein
MALTDTQLRNAKPAEKDCTIIDGQGLSILVMSKGATAPFFFAIITAKGV